MFCSPRGTAAPAQLVAARPFHGLGAASKHLSHMRMQPPRVLMDSSGPVLDFGQVRRLIDFSAAFKEVCMEASAALDAYQAIKSRAQFAQPATAGSGTLGTAASCAAQALFAMGVLQSEAAQHEAALACFEQSQAIATAHGDTTGRMLARHGIATSLHNLGDSWEATIEVWKDLLSYWDPSTEQYAMACRGAATTYIATRQPDEAVPLIDITWQHFVQYYGIGSVEMAHVLEVTGIAWWSIASRDPTAGPCQLIEYTQQRLKPANLDAVLAYIEEARLLRARHQGADSPDYLVTLTNLAQLHMYLGQYSQAEAAWQELVMTMGRKYGNTHGNTLRALVGWAGATVDPVAAMRLYGDASQRLGTAVLNKAVCGLVDGDSAILERGIDLGKKQCETGPLPVGKTLIWPPACVPPLSIKATPPPVARSTDHP